MEDAMQNDSSEELVSSNEDGFEAEFIHLSLIDSSYAKVIFQDVKDIYASDKDLICTYIVVAERSQKGDSIRLFKVGWSSVSDYVASVSCVFVEEGDGEQMSQARNEKKELTVVFEVSVLPPRNGGEFYQFCYITADDEIRGASTPFLFGDGSMVDDLVTENDIENDLLLIQTRTTILEENLQKTMKEKTTAQAEKQVLERKVYDQQLLVDSLYNLISSRTEVIEMLQTDLKTIEESVLQKEANIESITQDKKILEEDLKNVMIERDRLKESNNLNESRLKDKQNMISGLVSELASQRLTVGSLLHQRKLLNSTIDSSEQELIELKEKLVNETKERELLSLNEEDTKNMLEAMETSKRLALEELEEMRRQHNNLKTSTKELELDVNLLRSNNEAQNCKITDLTNELGDRSAENAALKTESSSLNDNLIRIREENTKLQGFVSELHNRLKMGSEEYKRKYIEWFKLQKRVAKLENKLKKKSSGTSVGSDENTNSVGPTDFQFGSLNVDDHSINTGRQVGSNDASACVRNLSPEQKQSLISEMENQLLKFQASNGPQCSTESTESTQTKQSTTATMTTTKYDVLMDPYPYPPFYPYPYPESCRLQQQTSQDNNGQPPNVTTATLTDRSPGFSLPGSLSDFSICGAVENFITCPMCSQSFCDNVDLEIVNAHIEEHFVYLCPICSAQFDKESEQDKFKAHVYSHLDDDDQFDYKMRV